MKFLLLSLVASGFCYSAQLKDVKSVYLYPMPGGFEQLLATQLVSQHVYTVVSDPKLADAVFTDQLGDSFLYKLDHIQAPPPPPPPAPGAAPAASTNVEVPHASSFSRGKGTLFLVDAKSKQVVWSIYQKPKDRSPSTLDKAARLAIKQLEVDNGMKPAAAH